MGDSSERNKSLDYLGAVNNLLEAINDKDEGVRNSIERSLVRMCKRRPNETIQIICQHRAKCAKLPESQISILFRVIESFVKENSDQLSVNCLDAVIELCTTEIVKNLEHSPLIQNPCLEILVSAGRYHCTKVMEGLLKQLPIGQVGHFMILHCIGSLSTANSSGMMPFVKQTLVTIIPTLNSIRFDYVKQAYSFALKPSVNVYQIKKQIHMESRLTLAIIRMNSKLLTISYNYGYQIESQQFVAKF